MRSVLVFVVGIGGCGRAHFDLLDSATIHDAPTLANKLACNTETAIATTPGGLGLDSMTWLSDASGDWIIGVEHTQTGAHPFRRHRVTDGPGGLNAADLGLVVSAEDPWLPTYLPRAGGWMIGFVESTGSGGYVLATDEGLASPSLPAAGVRVADYTLGSRALAPLPSGDFVLIGVRSAVSLSAQVIDASGASKGPPTVLATGDFGQASIAPTGSVIAVVWRDIISGDCHLATFDENLAMRKGPVVLDLAGCRDPQIAWMADLGRLAVVAVNSTDASLWYASWTEQLVAVEPPRMLADSAREPFISASVGGAWVSWITAAGPLGSARVGASSLRLPDLGSIDNTHALAVVGEAAVSLWERAGTVWVTRLCAP